MKLSMYINIYIRGWPPIASSVVQVKPCSMPFLKLRLQSSRFLLAPGASMLSSCLAYGFHNPKPCKDHPIEVDTIRMSFNMLKQKQAKDTKKTKSFKGFNHLR